MRNRFAFLTLLAVLAGCQGPILTGGFNQSPYRSYGVDGPGPGVIADNYQQMSLDVPAPPPGMPGPMGPVGPMGPAPACPMPPMAGRPEMCPPMMRAPMGATSQLNFLGLEGLTINWDTMVPGSFDSQPCICPAQFDFAQGAIYRLKLTNIPGRQGKELYPTLEIAPTMARTQAFLAHNSIPIEFTDNDFDQVLSGNFITKVIYLPNPEFQGLAMAGVGTLVNTQLEPGVDPIAEASNRGAILAIIRMGNKDLGSNKNGMPGMMPGEGMVVGGMPGAPMPVGMMQGYGSSIPQNPISGVNIAPYGTPMTKTTSGIPGPPQLPQGQHSPNRYPIVRTEPIPAPPTGYGMAPAQASMPCPPGMACPTGMPYAMPYPPMGPGMGQPGAPQGVVIRDVSVSEQNMPQFAPPVNNAPQIAIPAQPVNP